MTVTLNFRVLSDEQADTVVNYLRLWGIEASKEEHVTVEVTEEIFTALSGFTSVIGRSTFLGVS